MTESLSFDRAAEYYDRTRVTDPGSLGEVLDLLAQEFSGPGRILEIGVGTGAIALPLSAKGISLAGLDLSNAMMSKLVEKAGGTLPFPLIQADATRLPCGDGTFAGAYCRWVLHLIPDWMGAVAELCRVVREGGVIVTEPGGFTGRWQEMWLRFVDLLGDRVRPVGLDWVDQTEALDEAFAASGARRRELGEVMSHNGTTLRDYFSELEERLYSWTWRVPPEELMPAIAEVKAWAERTFPDFDAPFDPLVPMSWRAYDVG